MNNTSIITKIILSLLFILCLFDMPYGFYQLVRFSGMIGFAILAYKEYEKEKNNRMIFYIISIILINPIFKISLGRELWNIVDIIWAVILTTSIFIEKKEKKRK